ncbi:MAG: hypothetical protein EA426_01520 [Spirochaetaceae bacterium]|nr:MAG: hypothetical protein EA426_01520 [Spirochaetaceae bacterium]
MKRVVFLLGSPRGVKTGTESIANYLEARLPGIEVQRWRAHQIFRDGDQVAAFGESLRGAQLLVLCTPVYVHSLPWPFQEVLAALDDSPNRGGLSGLNVMTVIHSGYLEDIQRQTCFEMCQHFCRETGMVYRGGFGFGASPLIDGRPLESTGRLMRWVRRALDEMATCIAHDRELSGKATALIHRHFALMPRWLMIPLMKLKVERDAKKAGVDYRARPYAIDEPVTGTTDA